MVETGVGVSGFFLQRGPCWLQVSPCVELLENIWRVSFDHVIWLNILPVAQSIFILLCSLWSLILNVSEQIQGT